ncbi:hypothetical protein SAMN04489835_4497 [Mycolicibacterium rutilum]|uniref:Uncharacterized protein n=1 Tax=Mycolicibacterium rutilum TaxID=370526 RepID=A0A1H6L0Z8_MYCRU|nr:hypothetical protein [Mycolicibacterium rutilum]SEH81784.1 hypothetical protein SAMN04489835_4497 [Mycolicibacterium rutilum]
MTALQDWLSDPPMVPRSVKALICDVLRRQPPVEEVPEPEPQLLARGLERC